MSVLWKCDYCGGPAFWTVINGEAWYRCKSLCARFATVDLWEDGEYIDRVGSVRGLLEGEKDNNVDG